MGIYRTVSQSFWTDPKVVDCFTPEDKYFWLYLLTNPHTNLLGCYEISMKQISDETGYSLDAIRSLISRFMAQYGIIDYSESDKEILVKNWYKHNWAKSPKTLTAIERLRKHVKCDKFRDYLDEVISIKYSLSKSIDIDNNKSIDNNKTYNNSYYRERVESESDTVSDASIHHRYTMDGVSDGQNAQKPSPKMYGMYKNVILTDEEFEDLKKAYPDYEVKIDRLSVYMKQSGKDYASHYAVLTAWAKEDADKPKIAPEAMTSFDTDSFFEAAMARSYGENGGEDG